VSQTGGVTVQSPAKGSAKEMRSEEKLNRKKIGRTISNDGLQSVLQVAKDVFGENQGELVPKRTKSGEEVGQESAIRVGVKHSVGKVEDFNLKEKRDLGKCISKTRWALTNVDNRPRMATLESPSNSHSIIVERWVSAKRAEVAIFREEARRRRSFEDILMIEDREKVTRSEERAGLHN
jgi:hypothetical protein